MFPGRKKYPYFLWWFFPSKIHWNFFLLLFLWNAFFSALTNYHSFRSIIFVWTISRKNTATKIAEIVFVHNFFTLFRIFFLSRVFQQSSQHIYPFKYIIDPFAKDCCLMHSTRRISLNWSWYKWTENEKKNYYLFYFPLKWCNLCHCNSPGK